MLLSSPTPQFKGFRLSEDTGAVYFEFEDYDENQAGIKIIQAGIMDFVREYNAHFKEIPFMYTISGRDAYAPMLIAASYDEKYLKMIEKRFSMEHSCNSEITPIE